MTIFSGLAWRLCGGWLVCGALVCAGHAVAGPPSSVLARAGHGWGAMSESTGGHKKSRHRAQRQTQPAETTPSGESVKARERRLLRECRGRPNAGACLGYAS